MSNTEDQLYEVDLRQVERIKKLFHRLQNDLRLYEEHTSLIAQQESAIDYNKLGLPDVYVGDKEPEVLRDEFENKRNRVMLALKSAIWSTANSLKSDHDRAKVFLAQIKEKNELETVEG
jgi:hypothetical protein